MGRPDGVRVVGGYVRDRLLGRMTVDLDLAMDGDADTAARPARSLAKSLGVRAHLLGTAPHRIWRIETAGLKIEIWPLGDLCPEDDIRRRDFTCNALTWGLPRGPLVDLVGGLGDLRDRRLRAVSRANLEDDPVRLIRAPRFLARLEDFELEATTELWIRELAPTLATAPRERVGAELLSLLQAAGASRGLGALIDLGLFVPASPTGVRVDDSWIRQHLPAADRLNRRRPGDAARLAFLFRSWSCPTSGHLAAYAWPQKPRENGLRAARLLDDAIAMVGGPAADRREFAWRAGSAFPALIALARAFAPGSPWNRWRRQWRRSSGALIAPKPLLSGDELIELTGVEPGPELGAVVTALLRAQVRGEIRSRGGAIRWLQRHF